MNPALLDSGIGLPLADRTGPTGYGFFQALGVLFELVFVFENLTQEIEQQLSVRFPGIRNAIEDTIAVAAVQDNSRVLQVGKVPRDIRLRSFETYWMSQTQSSPCSKRFTIRSRFASASALNTCSTSIMDQTCRRNPSILIFAYRHGPVESHRPSRSHPGPAGNSSLFNIYLNNVSMRTDA